MLRTILLVACLLAGSVQAEGLFGERAEPGQMPSRFIRIDAADLGSVAFSEQALGAILGGELLKATCQWDGFRFGVACFEGWIDPSDGAYGPMPVNMTVPVYVGYDLWHNPKRTGFFYGAVPDIYAEAGASFYPLVTVKAALACDVDYYGIGLRAEGGYYAMPSDKSGLLYATLQLRLLTFGIGF